jgi:predicted ATPase
MFDALIRQFDARSSQSPVLMIFEDAHWSDPTSCELLDLAIARLASRPVLLLITFRPEFESPWTGRAHVTTLTLSRLPRRQSAELIGRVVGDDVLSSDIVGEIVERTDGIPLFLEELSKAVIEANRSSTSSGSGATRQATLAIPATLQASLIARLDRLDPAAKEVAQIGAAVGREFSHEMVAAVAGRPDSEVAEALERLVKSGLAFGRGVPPDAIFLFKHALVRDAAYSMLPRRKSRQLHGRIATVLEHRFADVVERLPAVVAHHCSEAGFTLRAIAYWGKAGRKSIAQSAMLEAVAQLRKGLDLLATLPNNAERWRQELELQTALAAALLASRGHGSPEVGEVYVRARALAERLGDAAGLAPILSGQFSFHLQRSEYAAGRQIAERLLQLDDGQGDPVGGVVGHRAMGVCTHQLGDFASAAAHFEQVLNLYIPDLHQSVAAVAGFDPRAAALRYLAFGQFIRGYSDQALSNMTEMMRWSRTLGHLYVMVHALNWTASFHLLRGDLQSALTPLEELLQLAEQKFPLWLALGQINRGLLLAKAGEPQDGLALGRRGFNAMMAIGSTWNQPYYKEMLAQTCELAGRPGEAMDELVTALAIVEQTGECWFAPELHRALGDWFIQHRPSAHAQAEEQFQSAMALAQEQNAKRWELRAATSLSRLRRDQGRHDEAYTLLAPLCAWFSEGRDLPDLRAGTALLQDLDLPARRSAYRRSAEGSRARGNRQEARRR